MGLPSPRSFWVPLTVVSLAGLAFGIVLARGQAELSELRVREAELRAELIAVERLHAALRQERQRLLSEPAAIERVAREDYGFAAPGEVALPFDGKQAAPLVVAPIPRPEAWWERLLGRGGYPLVVPASVFLLSVAVLGILEGISLLRRRQRAEA
jgi:cell division protein FtsB